MIIRCPHCEHTRSITESKIPLTAELATCPKCKNRFRFRTLRPATEPEAPATPAPRAPSEVPLPSPEIPIRETQRPQSAFRESAAQEDIWDAMDALHQRWQKQMDKNVTEVETPQPSHPVSEPEQVEAPPREEPVEPLQTVQPRPAEAPASLQPAPPVSEQPAQDEDSAEKKSGHGIFPYSGDGPDPEERVEQDMRMLRDASPERPLRDLGTLREFSDPQNAGSSGQADPDAQQNPEGADNAIPWENPARNGWLRGFTATLHGVMFKGPEFFSGFNASGSLAPGYLFFLIMGYVTIISSLAWTQAATLLLPHLAPGFMGRVGLPILLLLAPIALGLMLLFVTGCIRITLRIVAPDQADFAVIYRVVSYAVAPFILSIVPFVGPPLGAVWFLVSLITGCRNSLGLSWPLAVLVPLPPALMLLFGLAWYFL
ncbi:MAG: zinc-ribbon domain-containing protein [Desulfovibrionaceae bacterium]|nr:zinc-ribbon domain-containing protein [Desulfovibrionaceae bacterium]